MSERSKSKMQPLNYRLPVNRCVLIIECSLLYVFDLIGKRFSFNSLILFLYFLFNRINVGTNEITKENEREVE